MWSPGGIDVERSRPTMNSLIPPSAAAEGADCSRSNTISCVSEQVPTVAEQRAYRPDIDGLRAVAVLAVIIYHFSENALPSGFLGVDVFFVLSGFVITGSLCRQGSMSTGEFLVGFYARRVRRLVPALVVCVLFSALAISLFSPDPSESLKTGLGALFGVSNMLLLAQVGDYFAAPAHLNVYTHTWSLAVEEQFYVIFPLLLLLLGVHRNRSGAAAGIMRIVGFISVLSLGMFVAFDGPGTSMGFFLMPSRFWEIGAGVLTYLVLARSGLPDRTGLMAALQNVLLVLLVVLFLRPVEYATSSTIAAVVATAALLIVGATPCRNSGLLVHPAAIYVGKISYSLYLWHWPVLSISRWTIGNEGWILPIKIALIAGLAIASYHFVERPLRTRRWSQSQSRTFLIGLAALLCAAALLQLLRQPLQGTLFLGHVPVLEASGTASLSSHYSIPGTTHRWAGNDCILTRKSEVGKQISFNRCTLGSPTKADRRLLVLGDSFSTAFVAAFDDLVTRQGHSVTLVASWGAAPAPGAIAHPNRSAMSQDYWSRVVPHMLNQLRPGDTVLLINDLGSYPPDGSSGSSATHREVLRTRLQALAVSLKERGLRLAILYGIPFSAATGCEPSAAITQWYQVGSPCKFLSRDETLQRRKPLEAVFTELERSIGVLLIDVMGDFCPLTTCTYQDESGQLIYRDITAHPSIEAARLVAPRISRALQNPQ